MNETAARQPNRFLADLIQTMRSTAETARQGAIEQCQADAKAYTEQLQARTDDEAASLRRAAEADVSAIRDWSKAEMERIRVETEQRISRRRELLEQELQEYNSAVELEIQRVQQRVAAFEGEVALFFEQLLNESDPTAIANMAAQMPDPPTFDDSDRSGITDDLLARRQEIVGVVAPDAGAGSNGTHPADSGLLPELSEEALDARPEGDQGGAVKPASVESTQVVVVGLVSVASIATFKRQLGHQQGVKSVGVSSGPDGEFIFTVGHGSETSLGELIPTLPAFQARVVSEREGVINVSAHDPEADG